MAKASPTRLLRVLVLLGGCTFVAILLRVFGFFSSQCQLDASGALICRSNAVTSLANDILPPGLTSSRTAESVHIAAKSRRAQDARLTIFTAPFPYTDSQADPQRRALQSWLALSPPPNVVLLGNHNSFFTLAMAYPEFVSVDSEVECNFRGVPLMHSVLAKVQGVSTDLAMVVPAETLLFDTLYQAVEQTQALLQDFILVGARWKAETFPFRLGMGPNDARKWKGASGVSSNEDILHSIRLKGQLELDKVDLWLWNRPSRPLVNQTVPPFAYGRGNFDSWIMRKVISEGVRTLVDCSELLGGVVVTGQSEVSMLGQAPAGQGSLPAVPRWNLPTVEGWEVAANYHLVLASGVPAARASVLHAPLRLGLCPASNGSGSEAWRECLIRRHRTARCSCSYFDCATYAEAEPGSAPFPCASEPAGGTGPAAVPQGAASIAKERPRTVEELLPLVADKDKNVVLVAATHHYISMLMSFVCRLGMLSVGNVLVAAMDEELYDFAFVQGLPVYLEQVSDERGVLKVAPENCTYTSACFKKASKGKSQAVLHVLSLGYNVVFTDVDIVWFRNPIPHLMSFGPGVIPMQSDVWRHNGSANAQLNSGFYYARAHPTIIRAFEAIVEVERNGRFGTQQAYFNQVLCGAKYGGEKVGDAKCRWNKELVVSLLERDSYPNGQYGDFWAAQNVTAECETKGCFILHNNWISGRENKLSRFKLNNLWFYDEDKRLCKPTGSQ